MQKLIYLISLLTLNPSCVEKKSTAKETIKPEVVAASNAETLKFTSGIRAIFQDSKGNYWFGSLQEGVAVYNGKSFTYFSTNEGLTDNQIHSIQEDKNGIIWFGTQKGVSRYDGQSIKSQSIEEIGAIPGNWMKSDNDLWFAAGNKEGAIRYDGRTLNYLAFPIPKVINPNNLYAVTSISSGRNNRFWFGTYSGVFGYNGRNFTIINDEALGFGWNSAPLHIRSILEDSKGRLWIGNNGLGILLKEGDSLINFSEKYNLIHPTSKRKGDKSLPGTLEHVFTIAEDSQGNIWFGDRDAGVWKYDGKNVVNYTSKDGLSNYFALSIYEDNNKKLWFGLADGNVYQFNGKIFEKL